MSEPLEAARAALAGEPAWVVGGAVRDRLLGRATDDVDIAVAGDPRGRGAADRQGRRRAGVPARPRVRRLARRRARPRLARRRAAAARRRPGGRPRRARLHRQRDGRAARRRRARRPARRPRATSRPAAADGLARARSPTTRCAPCAPSRFAVELGFAIEPATRAAVRGAAPRRSPASSPERVFAELKRVVAAPRVRDGLELMDATGPARRGAARAGRAARRRAERLPPRRRARPHAGGARRRSSRWRPIRRRRLGGELAAPVAALLAEPLADELTRGTRAAPRARCCTTSPSRRRAAAPTGRVTFVGHDSEGAELARAVLRRLRASRAARGLRRRPHPPPPRLGFLVHERAARRAARSGAT